MNDSMSLLPGKTAKPSPTPSASTTPNLSSTIRTVCDILRRSNCTSALQYVPELTWILFLRILDAQETLVVVKFFRTVR